MQLYFPCRCGWLGFTCALCNFSGCLGRGSVLGDFCHGLFVLVLLFIRLGWPQLRLVSGFFQLFEFFFQLENLALHLTILSVVVRVFIFHTLLLHFFDISYRFHVSFFFFCFATGLLIRRAFIHEMSFAECLCEFRSILKQLFLHILHAREQRLVRISASLLGLERASESFEKRSRAEELVLERCNDQRASKNVQKVEVCHQFISQTKKLNYQLKNRSFFFLLFL